MIRRTLYASAIGGLLVLLPLSLSVSLEEGLAVEQNLFGNTFGNGEGAEGMVAFIEKRKANF